jgi:hypothetical protein
MSIASMARPTRHTYDAPGSFPRLLEAALVVAEYETDYSADPAFHGACERLRQAALASAAARPPHVLEAVVERVRRALGAGEALAEPDAVAALVESRTECRG